ncbi:hypothetical protein [Vibrio crassostreae]|uniref:hypothetical protein n=1 Tax=Vibrio crassostreae TaxID=246167 RepID=UPI001B315F15|nr:hypothetical protein [Vibrio crassostreae]
MTRLSLKEAEQEYRKYRRRFYKAAIVDISRVASIGLLFYYLLIKYIVEGYPWILFASFCLGLFGVVGMVRFGSKESKQEYLDDMLFFKENIKPMYQHHPDIRRGQVKYVFPIQERWYIGAIPRLRSYSYVSWFTQ